MYWIRNNSVSRMALFPVLSAILLLIIIAQNTSLIVGRRDSVIYTYTASFLNGNIGTGYGLPQTYFLSEEELVPGDIILGGYPGCAYGKYSHAGLYLGNGEVLEGYVDVGVSRQPLEHYMSYSYLCVLRVRTEQKNRNNAVNYALRYEGTCFYPVSFKAGDRYWNCTKVIWRAYLEQGINLDLHNDIFIAPESFCLSPAVDILLEKENDHYS